MKDKFWSFAITLLYLDASVDNPPSLTLGTSVVLTEVIELQSIRDEILNHLSFVGEGFNGGRQAKGFAFGMKCIERTLQNMLGRKRYPRMRPI